mmetsp:Transcript_3162/g.11335  ORF Transcript_3162/g.11335 Transcript_3162/m.11335 type:complete len:243 (-) Transcript_3162:553-1281(-)
MEKSGFRRPTLRARADSLSMSSHARRSSRARSRSAADQCKREDAGGAGGTSSAAPSSACSANNSRRCCAAPRKCLLFAVEKKRSVRTSSVGFAKHFFAPLHSFAASLPASTPRPVRFTVSLDANAASPAFFVDKSSRRQQAFKTLRTLKGTARAASECSSTTSASSTVRRAIAAFRKETSTDSSRAFRTLKAASALPCDPAASSTFWSRKWSDSRREILNCRESRWSSISSFKQSCRAWSST